LIRRLFGRRTVSNSRAVLVAGMHRSGTSAVTRGLQALSVYLGRDFLDAQPENPTGYWEDKGIVAIDERVLAALGLTWDSVSLIEPSAFESRPLHRLQCEAARYVTRAFAAHPLWGFKDPRAIRVLPFWRRVLAARNVRDAYVVAIRNPRSVAESLYRRQGMEAETAYRLWIVNVVPFLGEIASRPFVVTDYDLLMQQPRRQLERIATALELPFPHGGEPDPIDEFAAHFLDAALRHSTYGPDDIAGDTGAERLVRRAYGLLYALASEAPPAPSGFWAAWDDVREELPRIVQGDAAGAPEG
jgi:hypothetical protein